MSATSLSAQRARLEYFRTLVADDAHFLLLEAAAAVAQDDDPAVDAMAVVAQVDELGARLSRRLPSDAAAQQRLRLLNHYFFKELSFGVNVNDFYAPGNSHLHQVLQTRRGIPITLALIYLEMARCVGLKVQGVSFPGHFLCKCSLPQGEVIIDPMTGRSLSRDELDERLLPYRQQRGLVDDFEVPLGLFLQAASPRDILARLLRNLKEIHRAGEDWLRMKQVMDRLVMVLPHDWSERRDRALVNAELEQWAQAAEELKSYLQECPQAEDAPALRERLQELQRMARLH
ncbi:MAG: transglutaminase [Betaproteobacteria bacterium]|nr:transglutaminase [Betaproteobacteria bacterium]NBT10119.1 transglutaminase [Betaproteobacteria bacterium]NBU48961.1 transglutaminase [Betaproteobacteria bacterium]